MTDIFFTPSMKQANSTDSSVKDRWVRVGTEACQCRRPADKYSVQKSAANPEKFQTPLGLPILFAAVGAKRAHTPTASLSSTREYRWSPSVSKQAMAFVLGVNVPNTVLRSRCVRPREFCPMPACRNRSSKSVKVQFDVCHRKSKYVSKKISSYHQRFEMK